MFPEGPAAGPGEHGRARGPGQTEEGGAEVQGVSTGDVEADGESDIQRGCEGFRGGAWW